MKKRFFLPLLLLYHGTALAQHDFRKVDWFSSKAEVMIAEKRRPDDQTDNAIYYFNVRLGRYRADLIYEFKDDELRTATYFIHYKHFNYQRFFRSFLRVRDRLLYKHGKSEDQAVWSDPQFLNNIAYYGTAVALGQVVFVSKWQTYPSQIRLMLTGSSCHSMISIAYQCRFGEEDIPIAVNQ